MREREREIMRNGEREGFTIILERVIVSNCLRLDIHGTPTNAEIHHFELELSLIISIYLIVSQHT